MLNRRIFIPAIWIAILVFWAVVALSLMTLHVSEASARSEKTVGEGKKVELIHEEKTTLPNPQQRIQRVLDVQACMTNWGFIGSGLGHPLYDLNESSGGCFNPHPDEEWPAPSFEYPPGSGLEHLFWGGIWIGAKINDTAYTSLGCDGWQWIHELWPDGPAPLGNIIERSTIPEAPCYSEDAVSQQDIIAVYTDTSADIPLSPQQEDPWDNRKHHPLDVRITQKSYSWDTEGFDKFIIAEYTIENIGSHLLSEVYIAFYMDADIMHIDENPYGQFGAQDDITGFLKRYEVSPGEIQEVNIAWAADNDGHGRMGEFTWTEFSPRSVLGMKVLHTPNLDLQISYNWWISNSGGYPKDWGPWIASNQDVWESMNPYGSGNVFPDNVLGTPGGDASKYFLMSNREIDYDQIYSCVWADDHPEEGWLPPNPQCLDHVDGYDIRFLFSFGPFDQIAPGDSLIFAVAYVVGETLHVDPLNFLYNLVFDFEPDTFYANLDFSDLVNNALMAESVYHDILYNDPPDPFSLLSPPNRALTPQIVRFDWETATDPNLLDQVRYDLYLTRNPHQFPPSTSIDSNLTINTHIKTLDYGTYSWEVKAKDGRGGERWSNQIYYFTVTGTHFTSLGDFNGDGYIDVGDVVFAISYLYKFGPAPDPIEAGDCNCDGIVDLGDVLYLISYIYKGGPPPCE